MLIIHQFGKFASSQSREIRVVHHHGCIRCYCVDSMQHYQVRLLILKKYWSHNLEDLKWFFIGKFYKFFQVRVIHFDIWCLRLAKTRIVHFFWNRIIDPELNREWLYLAFVHIFVDTVYNKSRYKKIDIFSRNLMLLVLVWNHGHYSRRRYVIHSYTSFFFFINLGFKRVFEIWNIYRMILKKYFNLSESRLKFCNAESTLVLNKTWLKMILFKVKMLTNVQTYQENAINTANKECCHETFITRNHWTLSDAAAMAPNLYCLLHYNWVMHFSGCIYAFKALLQYYHQQDYYVNCFQQ